MAVYYSCYVCHNLICYFFSIISCWYYLHVSLVVLSELIVDEIKRRPSATADAALWMEVLYLWRKRCVNRHYKSISESHKLHSSTTQSQILYILPVLNCFVKPSWHRLEFMNEQKVLRSTYCTEYSLHKMYYCNSATWDFSKGVVHGIFCGIIQTLFFSVDVLYELFLHCFKRCAVFEDTVVVGFGDECIPEFLWAPKGNNRFVQPIGTGFVVTKLCFKQQVTFGLFDSCPCPKRTILLCSPQS